MRSVIAFFVGGLFGAGLLVSGMTDTAKVQGFLDFSKDWDVTLAFVMGGAVIPMAIAWRLTLGRRPAMGGKFPDLPPPRFDANLIGGSILFGMGWGLAGLCPGPAMASFAWGGLGGTLFLLAMIAGMVIAPPLRNRLDATAQPR